MTSRLHTLKHTLIGLLIALMAASTLLSCQTHKQLVTETVIETRYVDSITYKDSITYIPQEYYHNVAWHYDTLHLETTQATAVAWVDSTFLRGYMKNKKIASQQVIQKTEFITRDSIVYKEKPVPYEVEVVKTKNAGWPVWLWAISVSCGLVSLTALWIGKKLRLVHMT